MQITVAAVGTRLEPWVYAAIDSYQKRLPRHLNLNVEEVAATRRAGAGPTGSAVEAEGAKLLRHVRADALTFALDERGHQWTSRELAEELRGWQSSRPRVAILVGGPDGLSDACRQRADRLWSLSRLTFPHGLARVILIEQLYRACTILEGHPYHRN